MKKDKQFIISSIKMDLHRVVQATGDLTKELPKASVVEFLKHADKDFDKVSLTKLEKRIRKDLRKLAINIDDTQDPHKRLRWAEDVLTARCRL